MVSRQNPDPKLQALREARALNPRPEAVTDEEFASSEFLDARDLVQVKYEMVRRVHEEGATVTAAAASFGFSRQSFYQAADALERGGLPALVPAKPGPRAAHKLTGPVLDHLQVLLAADPSLRSADLAEAVEEHFGVRVHPRSVERALARSRQGQHGSKSA
jgi:transposase